MNSTLTHSPPMMVNFMCQLDGATRCPDIWSNITLSLSVRVFLDEKTFELVE